MKHMPCECKHAIPPKQVPEKPKYVPPKKPFRKKKPPFAIIATALVLSLPPWAKADSAAPLAGPKPDEAAKSLREGRGPVVTFSQPTIEGEYTFNGGSATIEQIPRTDNNIFKARYRIGFHVDGRRFPTSVRFDAPLPSSLGNTVGIFVSGTRTVILTDNYLVVTQGYQDVLDNPGTLQMDGSRLDENAFSVRLPDGLRGGGIFSAAVADGPTGEMSTLFALGNNSIWSFRTDLVDGSPAHKEVSISGRASLHAYMDYVFLFQPDSEQNFVSIYRRDAAAEDVVQVARFSVGGQASVSDAPTVSEVPGGFLLSCGARSALVTFDEAANTFTVAATAPPNKD